MIADTYISGFDLLIFLGVFQAVFLSGFFIRSGMKEVRANLYQGLLILALSMSMFEELLNNTGYIVRVLAISNFAEPLNFAFGPLAFLFIRSLLYPESRRKNWPHFILLAFWVLYMIPYFIQSNEYKYNSYVGVKHPDWEYLDVPVRFFEDPAGIRDYVNQLTGMHFTGYILAMILLFFKRMKEMDARLLGLKDTKLRLARNVIIHFLIVIVIFAVVKLSFPGDIGDYFISSYLSFMMFSTAWMVVKNSAFFVQPQFFLQFPGVKYEKSSLSEQEKAAIHGKIIYEMEKKHYYARNLASLKDLAQAIKETPHHVSQVINEVMGKGFFELLAWYRVEEAKRIISRDREGKLTVEDIAEQVGYNSKSSFNTVFKKLTGQTPSEFRRTSR